MASFTISYSDTAVTFQVSGLSSGDRVRFWVAQPDINGTTVVDQSYTSTANIMTRTFSGLSPSTNYTAYVGIGEPTTILPGQSFTTDSTSQPPAPTRPSNWVWATPPVRGNLVSNTLTAAQWNAFTARVNAFRSYVGLSTIPFATATRGAEITTNIFNTVLGAIRQMGTVPANPSKGNEITAAMIVQMTNGLNSIPVLY
jgi:hypothetical protein